MKQQIVLIGLVFAMLTAAYSQNGNSTAKSTDTAKAAKEYCPHRIWVNLGMAYSNDIYNRFNKFDDVKKVINQKYAFSNVLEVGYAYFFHPKMGVGLGVGVSRISAKALLGTGGTTPKKDSDYIPGDTSGGYRLDFVCDNFGEKQAVWAIEVPLTFQFETRLGKAQRHGIFASLGVKGYFPLSGRTKFAGGEIELQGYDEFLNVHYPTTLLPHFGTVSSSPSHATAKLKPSIDLIADFGGLIGLTKGTDLYLGLYLSYGFMDILPKEKTSYLKDEYTTPSGMLASNALEEYNKQYADADISEKWNVFQAGVKLGFRFKPCSQRSQSLREDKRDFFDKYEDRLNNAAKAARPDGGDDDKKGKGKGKNEGEPVYIIPIYLGNSDGNDGYDRAGNEKSIDKLTDIDPEVRKLIQALTNAQIYFDLDKDIPKSPKVAQREVEKAVTILKNNPELKIILDGYTCRLGTETHNADLAQRRANTIRNMFIAKGVDPKQIETEAFTASSYPQEVLKSFYTLEDARTVIFKIVKR